MLKLVLRELSADDEAAARAAHAQLLGDDFEFLLGDSSRPWVEYMHELEEMRRGINLPDGFVPATFFGAFVGGELVGRVSVRHELNDYLLARGGHIGYAVLPAHRRRGYGTEILAQALRYCASELGLDRVLVTFDETNAGSRAVIEANGGVLEDVREFDGERVRRYWIALVQ
ncbi:GNAT family N-acetyltransferase [Arcanobacterium wilhelmae]|uniref:GNAT family N-acetyltransferase n=1 Tax=Arcanobacterium wilhelmae TaxID=1803177 RepID=UPI002414ECC7|nr:GNAT family N-acetyltransferase [Arcanobacterium wilhelmae]WFN89576.1 GNAT family N-acetyltransferase [Arcanobacterium wilhelmae]